MPFGGGDSGSYSLQDHKHTNALQDGGSLEELVTLVDGATLAAWVAGKFIAAGNDLVTQVADDSFTVNNTWSDFTSLTTTLPDNDNKSLILVHIPWYSAVLGAEAMMRLNDNGVAKTETLESASVANYKLAADLKYIAENNGQVVKVQGTRNSGNSWTAWGSGSADMYLTTLELP